MRIVRHFTKGLKSPYDGITFEARRSEIRDPNGRQIFLQSEVIVPSFWSQLATDILAQKYFRKTDVPQPGKKKRTGAETDCRQVFHRLAGTWTDWGKRSGYFSKAADADAFYDEICYMLAHQMAAPNSPQWFNTGLNYAYGITGPAQGHYFVDEASGKVARSTDAYSRPQPHACFILSVNDDLVGDGGIMDLWVREARLFKFGSGTGTNFSSLRAGGEPLSGGGVSSGLMSFLRVGDRAAGAIKSGGTSRRAAKMVCLDLDHPEIEAFIDWKILEEQKVSALVAGSWQHREKLQAVLNACFEGDRVNADVSQNPVLREAIRLAKAAHIPAGYVIKTLQLAAQGHREIDFPLFDVDWQNEAYLTVSGQNANNSVRIANRFFSAVDKNEDWELKGRVDGKVVGRIPARRLWEKIVHGAWNSADPGVQFETTIDEWHTCPAGGRIRASNPCSEYLFLDDTACNLASLNLLRFENESTRKFEIEAFSHACRLWTLVLEISVTMAQYPSAEIAKKSFEYRTLGLGYSNLGALLMARAIAYGSPEALALTGALTSLMTAEAYATSAELARDRAPFARFMENRDAMLRVLRNHRRVTARAAATSYEKLSIVPTLPPVDAEPALTAAALAAWDRALSLGEKHGFRNAQATAIAPTGTIGLLMDCDTMGIEPDYALVKFKKLAGGGFFRMVNQTVPRALARLGYSAAQGREIVDYCAGHGTLRGAPHLNPDSLRAKGFSDEVLSRLESELGSAFELRLVFNVWTLGREFCRDVLKLSDAELSDPDLDLLGRLGFAPSEIEEAEKYISGAMTLEGAPFLKAEHYGIFDCANRCGRWGRRQLSSRAHLETLAAAQPFVSGGISKTINLPAETTEAEVGETLRAAWRLGLKSVSIYRDGSKLSQPLTVSLLASGWEAAESVVPSPAMPAVKRELPGKRYGYTVKATIGGQRVYLRTGEYDDGGLGEIFVDVYKEGTAYRSLMNAFAIAVSMGLQYGVPLDEFVRKFHLFRFEPNGFVADHDRIRFCSSIIDFIFRDLALNYLGRSDLVHIPESPEVAPGQAASAEAPSAGGPAAGESMRVPTDLALTKAEWSSSDAFAARMARERGYTGDACPQCGQLTMVQSGTCLRCESCGTTSGCS